VTYEQLDQRANELARRLMANGAAPDRLVAIYLPRSVNCLVAILGVLKSGAAYLPIDVQIPKVRAEGLLQDANSCAIFDSHPPSGRPLGEFITRA
jgi:non-ribosomal peptide synthetase component F